MVFPQFRHVFDCGGVIVFFIVVANFQDVIGNTITFVIHIFGFCRGWRRCRAAGGDGGRGDTRV